MDRAGKLNPPHFAETELDNRDTVFSRPMLPALIVLAPGPRQSEAKYKVGFSNEVQGLALDADIALLQVHGCLQMGNHFETLLAERKINNLMIHLQLKADPVLVENLPAINAAGILLQGLPA